MEQSIFFTVVDFWVQCCDENLYECFRDNSNLSLQDPPPNPPSPTALIPLYCTLSSSLFKACCYTCSRKHVAQVCAHVAQCLNPPNGVALIYRVRFIQSGKLCR